MLNLNFCIMKKLLLFNNAFMAALVAVVSVLLFSCGGKSNGNVNENVSEAIEISENKVLVIPTDDLSSATFSSGLFGGSEFSCMAFGQRKVIRLKESYDLGQFDDCTVSLTDENGQKKIKPLDVYEVDAFTQGVVLAKDIKGITLKKRNGKDLTILLWKRDSFWANRTKFDCGRHNTLARFISGKKFVSSELVVSTDEVRGVYRGFLLPVFLPDKDADNSLVVEDNFEKFKNFKGLQPQNDTTIVFCSQGYIPQIECVPDGNGGSYITIYNARKIGESLNINVGAEYDYTPKEVFNDVNELWYKKELVAGAAFCLPNGKVLTIIQSSGQIFNFAPDRWDETLIQASSPKFNPFNLNFRVIVFFKKDYKNRLIIPAYLPKN